jgi:hypothetical protein
VRATAKQYTDHNPGTDAHPDSGSGSERTSRAGAVAHLGPVRTGAQFYTGAPGTECDPDTGASACPWHRADTD